MSVCSPLESNEDIVGWTTSGTDVDVVVGVKVDEVMPSSSPSLDVHWLSIWVVLRRSLLSIQEFKSTANGSAMATWVNATMLSTLMVRGPCLRDGRRRKRGSPWRVCRGGWNVVFVACCVCGVVSARS